MRIINPNNATSPFYAGICKNNEAPKHVLNKDTAGTRKDITLDGKKAIMFEAPKSKQYIYIKAGQNWLYIKDKVAFEITKFETTRVTKSPKGEAETTVVAQPEA